MLTERLCNRLKQRWHGPAIRVVIQGKTYHFGIGTPRSDVILHKPAMLARLLTSPSLAFGEAYMRGEIEVEGHLMNVLEGAYRTFAPSRTSGTTDRLQQWLPEAVVRQRAAANAQHHYDIGNDFYRFWLDPSLTYSCAYFLSDDDDTATAQQQKLELLCRKARLQPGQHMLDIGCGWGSLMFHAARHHGAHVTGVTPAAEQAQYIKQEAKRQDLGHRVSVIRGDWRNVTGQFDRVLSVGMFEHVGQRHYRAFLNKWHQLLSPGGLSVLHTIGRMKHQRPDPWIRRYIFPGGYLPTLAQIVSHSGAAGLSCPDIENLRQHYARTLAAWSANYEQAWDQVVAVHGERFARMWWLYLQGAEAAFRWGGLHLWQVVLARGDQASWPLNREVRAEASCVSSGKKVLFSASPDYHERRSTLPLPASKDPSPC
jgi:cyclopropane-fatty-acyl-phospholipid synthase